ncbi:MAG: TetR/AcrR family transcriptional regulator [Actinomycetota bacterium]
MAPSDTAPSATAPSTTAPSDKVARREERILDAASELFVRYGYDKTTVDEIAKAAGVSKGMIYLHAKSKQDLLEKLIVREMERYGPTWLEQMDDDAEGGTIAGLYRGTLRAMRSSPFMEAVFHQDGHVFGNYLRQPDNIYRRLSETETEPHRRTIVRRMQETGAMRDDLSADVVAHIMNIIAVGLVTSGRLVAAKHTPPIEEVVEGIAVIMDRALTPAGGSDPDETKAIVREASEHLYRSFATLLADEA